MSAPQHQPPPGWYPDPTGRPIQRYWDGAQWVGPEYPLQHQASTGTPRRPLWRRWWVITPALTLAGLFILFIGLGVLFAFMDLGESTDTVEPAQNPKPEEYSELSERQFAEVVRDPDAHAGDRIVVYGRVVQYDAATGGTSLRADTTALRDELEEFFLGQNTVMRGREEVLSQVVKDDLFRAHVTVLGSETYQTGIGGQATVPEFRVDILDAVEQVD